MPTLSPALKAHDGKGPSSDGDGDSAPLIVVGTLPSGATRRGHGTAGVNSQAVAAGHVVAFGWNKSPSQTMRVADDTDSLQASSTSNPAVYAIQERAVSENLENGPGGKGYREGEAYTLEARNKVQATASMNGVRRLTPRECERLMSWPDDWTRWGHDGKEMADGPRYRMCGNGVVSNCAEWIGRRLMAVNGQLSVGSGK